MDKRDLPLRGLRIQWDQVPQDSYLRGIPALNRLEGLDFRRPVTLFCGENGTGKSTLLEAAAVALGYNAEGGTRNFRFSTYQDVSTLHQAMRLIRGAQWSGAGYFFRAETFFNVSTAIMERYNDDGVLPDYHSLSHGESFLSFMQDRSRPGLYLMDEPEAALSPQRQLSLLLLLYRMAGQGSQFLIATHSPIILGIPEADILCFDDTGVHPVAYEETESYQVTRSFVTRREQMLRLLLDEEDGQGNAD